MNEEERKQAWLEYEEEKKGKPLINPLTNMSDVNTVNQNDTYLQQYMMYQNAVSLQFQRYIRENVST